MSVCVVNNFFKQLLLTNGWANLNQTWQECSKVGGPLQKMFTEFDSIKYPGCHGNQMDFLSTFLSGTFVKTFDF